MTIPLGGLRALSERYLPELATIQQGTETASGDGTSVSWATKQANVPCRISPIGRQGLERMGADQSIQAIGQWTLWLPHDTDITDRDRIVVGSRTFEVAEVVARSFEVIRAVICREIT